MLGPRGKWVGLRYLGLTVALMIGFYAVLYHPYSLASWPGRALHAYLRLAADASGAVLRVLGESVAIDDTRVNGRFPFVVILDCAALDAQALYAAAVLAFPVAWWLRLAGVALGLVLIFGINIARLVVLYFAGATSVTLFHVLHEEVLVFVVIGLVCLLFVAWTGGARVLEGRVSALRAAGAFARRAPASPEAK